MSSLLGATASVVAPLVPRRSTLVSVSLSPHSSCVSGTLAVRVALLELGAPLALEVLELVTLLLEALLLTSLELGVPVLGVLRLLVSGLLGVAAYVVTLVGVSLSPHSSYTSGTLAVRVALLELRTLPLVALLLTSLELGVPVQRVLELVSAEQATLERLGLRTLELVVLLTLPQEVLLELLALELGVVLVLCAGGAGAAGPGGARTGGTGAAGAGGATGPGGPPAGGTGAGDPGAGAVDPGAGGVGPGGAATGRPEAGDPGAGGAGSGGAAAGGAGAGGAGAGGSGAAGGAGATGAGGTAAQRLFFSPLSPSSLPPSGSVLRQVLSLPSSTGLSLQPGSPLPAPSPYTEQTGGPAERREPASRPVSPVRTVRTGRRVPRERPPAVPGTHLMALRPSSAPQRVPLPSPLASSLPYVPDPESDHVRAAHPTVTRLLATVVTDPSFESTAASALVAELVDFAAACRLDYAASLVAESESVCPPSVGGECALSTDVLEDRQEDFECLAAAVPHLVAMLLAPEGEPDAPDIPTPRSYVEAIAGEYSSQWQVAMDAEMASWKSTGTYVDEVPPPRANIVDGMWIFRVKRPPGSPPVFKARYVARGFSQRQGVDFFQTFSPTPKMTTLRVLLHVAAQRDYELHSLDFSTAFLQGSLHEEIWLRRPPGFTGSFPPGTQ
ncbi:unnamed protein product [Closterium sp. Yama58-4]|nr:unnamed protein product [Closterium sp. Yama58-4]